MEAPKSITTNKKHGSPWDRGSADRYYGRTFDPHKWPEGTGKGTKVTKLTEQEIEEYRQGWLQETDRKMW